MEEPLAIKLRPIMKAEDMVAYLKNKNIKFNLISEEDAEKYLKYNNNNYYNLTSYKSNFENTYLMANL